MEKGKVYMKLYGVEAQQTTARKVNVERDIYIYI